MYEIGTFEAKNKLSALLERVERGEEILITRRGKPVAMLVPAIRVPSLEAAHEAANRILERSRSPRAAFEPRAGQLRHRCVVLPR